MKKLAIRLLMTLFFVVVLIMATNGAAAQENDIMANVNIPTIDISGGYDSVAQGSRHVIIGEGTNMFHNAHPFTLLMPDGKTMFCSWPHRVGGREHGAIGGMLKRSDDGGLTWGPLIEVPANWREIGRGNPPIHRIVDPDGVERLFVFQRTPDRSEMLQAISEDGGETWSEYKGNGLTNIWTSPASIEPVNEGKKYLMWYEKSPEGKEGFTGVIWQSATYDGGLTWVESKPVVEKAGASEPSVVWSPDGKQILMFMREQDRVYNSLYATSDDEGETWSEAHELPLALTGDRHIGKYTPDGRLIVAFRDRSGTWTNRQFVAWVGTYEDIIEGREGQYRVKLLHCHAGDSGYPGLEVLPDGTIFACTYLRYVPDEYHYVVGTRFNMDELDEKYEKLQ